MIQYREFLNCDSPAVVEIWRRQPSLRGLAQPMTTALFDQHVLSKPYFDRQGLILAWDEDRPVGLIHAGFGPDETGAGLSHERGVICMLMAAPHERQSEISAELVQRGESYLRQQGAAEVLGGAVDPLNPFYWGLYGGTELPGALATDSLAQESFAAAGFGEFQKVLILQRGLSGFRPPVGRKQILARRNYVVEPQFDPAPESWWEACLTAFASRVRFVLRQKSTDEVCGHATYWDVEPLATTWGVRAAGLTGLWIRPDQRRQGLATFLLAESLRELQQHGATLAEAQTLADNEAAAALYAKLGFEEVEHGVVWRKELSSLNRSVGGPA